MNSRDKVLLHTLLDTIQEIDDYIKEFNCQSFQHFNSQPVVKRAVTMCMISISELVDTLSDEFRSEHDEINYRRFKQLRNIAAHKYGAINFEILWEIVTKNLPQYKMAFGRILKGAQP